MQVFPPTVVIRHKRENLKKCSLRGLETRHDFIFFTYPQSISDPNNYILLTLDAPPLTAADACHGLLVLDATWRYAAKMLQSFKGSSCLYRSLPPCYRTAYPRRQHDCPNPEQGLASIEAIFLSYYLLGRPTLGLLDHYYWKEMFLKMNSSHLQ